LEAESVKVLEKTKNDWEGKNSIAANQAFTDERGPPNAKPERRGETFGYRDVKLENHWETEGK